MNPEQQRIAIAEACGWTQTNITHKVNGRNVRYGFPPNSKSRYEEPLPDYLNDLNAMHEAVNNLDHFQRLDWIKHMEILTAENSGAWFPERFIQANARMWAAAFLRAIGKWKD